MGEPTPDHPFVPHPDCSQGASCVCAVRGCWFTPSEHPASPPGPAPESEEPPIVGNAYGTYSWRPDPAPESPKEGKVTAEDRREDREAKLRERASEIDADAHDNYCGTTCPPDDSHDAPLFIKRVLDALRQTEEEALQRGKEHAEQMHAALGGKSPASSPEND